MYNTDMPTRAELPSSAQLVRSTLIAAGVAAALLVTVVLPAEYGIDPTGAGRRLDLTEMGQLKRAEAESAAAARAEATRPLDYRAGQRGQKVVSLARGEGREVKAEMRNGGKMTIAWTTNKLP